MHALSNTHATVEETVTRMAADGRRPVVVWLPIRDVFDVYLCDHDESAPIPTLRALASVGIANDATGYDKDGPTWMAHNAGAGFRRFRSRVPPHATATRVVLPCGRSVFAV